MAAIRADDQLLEEGGIYITRASWRRWLFFRVLKLTDELVHLRFYNRKFWRRPTLRQLDRDDWSLGHMPITRLSVEQWNFECVGTLLVQEDELQGYRIWEETKDAGVFL